MENTETNTENSEVGQGRTSNLASPDVENPIVGPADFEGGHGNADRQHDTTLRNLAPTTSALPIPDLVPDVPASELTIYFRDVKSEMVQAWQQAFDDPRIYKLADKNDTKLIIDIKKESAFSRAADALICPIFGNGDMSLGLSKALVTDFDKNIEVKLREKIAKLHSGLMPIGKCIMIKCTEASKFRFIIFVSYSLMAGEVDKLSPFLSFKSVLELINSYNVKLTPKIKSVVCVGIGTGVGMVPFFRSAVQMRVALDSFFGAGFRCRSKNKQQKIFIVLTTVQKPFNIKMLYDPEGKNSD